MKEPLLNRDDKRRWQLWRRVCLAHAETPAHRRVVDQATRTITRMVEVAPDAYLAWSAGKDSTVMVHLASQLGVRRAMSIKDDLDFPGERAYVERLGEAWGVDVDVVTPPLSLADLLRAVATEAGEDLHARSAAFSRVGFYDVIDRYRETQGCPGVYLGLRAEESHARRMNARRGAMYTKKQTGERVCQPLRHWTAKDVYGYACKHRVPLLPVYRCVRLHASPGDVRKSWWIPGTSARYGQAVWLRTYYPSLWRRACELVPGLSAMA